MSGQPPGKQGQHAGGDSGAQTDAAQKPRPSVGGPAAPPAPSVPPAQRPSGPSAGKLTSHQKQALQSNFQDGARARKIANVVGGGFSTLPPRPSVPIPPPAVTTSFDGTAAPEALRGRDVWKAVQPPVTSVPSQRTAALTDQVIKQFAVGTNPRYESAGPEGPRAHIFVWDVSRAMGCEIPHFTGAKELTLAQTCDWVKHEGPVRGWRRVSEPEVFTVLASGQLVVAVPREIRHKWIAVAPPQGPTNDRKPLLSGACLVRGHLLHVTQLFGVRPLEYFTHP